MKMKVILPKLYEWQQEVFDYLLEPTNKRCVIRSFRQGSGKTFLCEVLLVKFALTKKCDSIFITPVLKQATQVFSELMNSCKPLIETANKSAFEISFKNGSKIFFRSAESDDSIRGLTCSGICIIDESAWVKDDFIYKALPLVKVHKAPVLLVSSPLVSEGFFWNACNSPDWKEFDWSIWVDKCFTKEELEFYKRNYSPTAFQTEILGKFIPKGQGLLFNNIIDCLGEPTNRDGLVVGVDCSSSENGDYTAVTVVNRDYEVVDVFYNNTLKPVERINWIAEIINNYKPTKVVVERNSMGDTFIDLLKKLTKYPITGWVTSNKSKRDIIEHLQYLFEQKIIKIKNDQELIKELQSFQAVMKNKIITYSGKNCKDDCVMSLAICCYAIKSNLGNYSIA